MAAGDVYQKFGTAGQITITLAALATNSSRLVGRQSLPLDISLLNCTDLQISGKITTGSGTLTASQAIEVWAVGSIDGATYPGPISGADLAATFVTVEQKSAILGAKLVASMLTTTAIDTSYEFNCHSLAAVFGGMLPYKVVFFVTHSTGQNLHATAGNHHLTYQPTFYGVAAS